jgi:polyisoprenoid-binding protein YceI
LKKLILLFLLGSVAGVASHAQTSAWDIDPAHANAQFLVRHLGISNVQGEFTNVTGSIQLNEGDMTKSTVNAAIDVKSLTTRNSMRDDDLLKNPGFFDVAHFPTMTFQSKKISKSADGKLTMSGDLTLRGVTHTVDFALEGPSAAIKDPWGKTRRGVAATATIKRQDFGMNADPVIVGDDIKITLDVEFVKK